MKSWILIFSIIMALPYNNIQSQDNDPAKPGLRARMIYATLKAGNLNEKIFARLLKKPKRGTKAMSPNKFHRKLTLQDHSVDGFRVLTIRGPESANHHIILLHGGAYTAEAMAGHRILMEKLALKHHFTVSFIGYPLAPEHDAEKCLQVVHRAYMMLINSNKKDTFYLVGDSAGGGLALALLQQLRDRTNSAIPREKKAIPRKNILLSPWLDVSMSNPDIDNYRGRDLLLDAEGLKECGRMYAGDKDLKDPTVSPLFGNLEHLSDLQVFVSTHELFYPDCRLLTEKAKTAEGTNIELRTKKKMVHDWTLLPIKERDETIAEMAGFLIGK